MIGEHTEEEASLYVLGMLPPDEARRFEAAIAADPELAELVARLETGAAAFACMTPPRDPPPALRGRIMERIARETVQPGKVVRFPVMAWMPWAAAACLALFAGELAYERYHLHLLLDSFVIRDRAQQRELDRVQGREAALEERLAAAAKEKADLQGELADLRTRDTLSEIKIATLASMLKDAPQAMAVVAWDGKAQRGILKTMNMPAARADQDYQLWIIDPAYKQPVSAGIFDPGRNEKFHPVQPISKAGKFAISLEKKGGSTAPQGPIVLVGE